MYNIIIYITLADSTIIDYFCIYIVWIYWCQATIHYYLWEGLGRTEGHRLVSPGGAEVKLGVSVQGNCAKHLENKNPSWLWWSLWSLPRPGWSAGAGSHGAAPCCTAAAARGQQSKPDRKRNITVYYIFLASYCFYILKLKLVSSLVFLVWSDKASTWSFCMRSAYSLPWLWYQIYI